MIPLQKLAQVTLGIIVSGISVGYVSGSGSLLFGWLWFNLFIAIYEFYIVYNRDKFHKFKCPVNYWQEQVSLDSKSGFNFWLNTWHEYTCQSDLRYLNPSSYVFYIELTNAILVVLLWIAFLTSGPVFKLLWSQLLVCTLYFLTLTRKNLKTPISAKTIIYLLISSLWIIVPLTILSLK